MADDTRLPHEILLAIARGEAIDEPRADAG